MVVRHLRTGLLSRSQIFVTAILAAVAVPIGASAQNGYSFAAARDSAVPYTEAGARARVPCASLVALTTHDYSIVSAALVEEKDNMPEHCRVSGVIPPEIRFEVNLPTAWNRRFYMHGNGGYAGTPPDHPHNARQRDNGLRHGFATAYTNTGHDSEVEPLATFAHDNLQKEIDYGFRAVHLTVVTAKELLGAYYGDALSYSYWDGCSTGGRQGLMSAQRFPGDFDGVIAGAPVLNFTDTVIWGTWNAKALLDAPISLAKVSVVARKVYARCDSLDGLEDGLIDDPRECDFDPAKHLPQCAESTAEGCLIESEIRALEKIYNGVISNGKVLFPGQLVGAEAGPPSGDRASGWNGSIVNENGPSFQRVFAETFLKYMAFEKDDPHYDWKTFDFDEDPAKTGFIRSIIDARNPDLSAFQEQGGKILMYFGWADTAVNPLMGVDYYEQVVAKMSDRTTDFFRLFMVPGMFHCQGGLGVDRFDALTHLIDWVEFGKAPDRIVAARIEEGMLEMTRPLCPYPETARYRGSGNTNDEASFECVEPQ